MERSQESSRRLKYPSSLVQISVFESYPPSSLSLIATKQNIPHQFLSAFHVLIEHPLSLIAVIKKLWLLCLIGFSFPLSFLSAHRRPLSVPNNDYGANDFSKCIFRHSQWPYKDRVGNSIFLSEWHLHRYHYYHHSFIHSFTYSSFNEFVYK